MTKKQVRIAWIVSGSLVGVLVIYKIVSAAGAAKAAALRTQQLNAASTNPAAQAAAGTVPPLIAPVSPVTIVNTDPNDPANIQQITATSAPSNIAPIAIV